MTGGVHIVHFTEQDGKWTPDKFQEHFIDFEPDRPNLPYRSIALIALPLSGSHTERVGVLCIEGVTTDCFDAEGVQQQLLPALGAQAVAAILISQQLLALSTGQQQVVIPAVTKD